MTEKKARDKFDRDTKKEINESFEKQKNHYCSDKSKGNNISDTSPFNPFVGKKCPHGQ
jgi:hypothetical protein